MIPIQKIHSGVVGDTVRQHDEVFDVDESLAEALIADGLARPAPDDDEQEDAARLAADERHRDELAAAVRKAHEKAEREKREAVDAAIAQTKATAEAEKKAAVAQAVEAVRAERTDAAPATPEVETPQETGDRRPVSSSTTQANAKRTPKSGSKSG